MAQAGKPPDFFYCKSLLEAKGIVTVPGTGFKQAEGTLHFRTTILPPESDIEATAQDLTDFHEEFMKKVRSASWRLSWSDRTIQALRPVMCTHADYQTAILLSVRETVSSAVVLDDSPLVSAAKML